MPEWNPEEVERRQGCLAGQPDFYDYDYVLAEDYDQLLEMYRELKAIYEGLCK